MFKLKGWAEMKWGAARRRESEKKKFPEHSRKLFSLDSFKSRHPVLEFSNHHQRNLQSEHTASQFRPAHLLTLAPAELCVLHCVCVRVCVYSLFAIWDLGDSAPGPDKGGVNLCGAEATARIHMFPLFHIHICTLLFFFSFLHTGAHTP